MSKILGLSCCTNKAWLKQKRRKPKNRPKNAKLWVIVPTDYNNPLRIANVMEHYRGNHGISLFITGGSPGCEQLVEEWCRKLEIAYHGLPHQRWGRGDPEAE